VTHVDPLLLSLDPVGLFIPTELTFLGGGLLHSVSSRFTAGPGELGGYLGPVLIGILTLFAWERRRESRTALLFGIFALAILLAMGPRLNVLGSVTPVRLPWTPFIHLPITELVIPVRIMLFAWVAVAVVVALWLSTGRSWWRWAVVGCAAITLLPNTSYEKPPAPYIESARAVAFWHSTRFVPRFFEDGTAQTLLGDKNVLVLPYGWAEASEDMVWNAAANMSFRMPEAYVGGTIPPEFLCWPVVGHMLSSRYPPEARREFLAFLSAKGVDAVVAGNRAAREAATFLSQLVSPRVIKGVHVYRVPRHLPRSIPPGCIQ
jgi:hypothetical protein